MNIFNKNKYFSISTKIIILVVFISVAVFYNFLIAKQAEALFGSSLKINIFGPVLKAVRNAILDVIQKVIRMIVEFVIDNKELFMAAAIVWKWYTSPDVSLKEVWDTVKSVAMQIMLTLITMDIIAEIQGEETKYINDWGKFFEDTINMAGGLFIDQYLGMGYLCEPFDIDIKVALLDEFTFDTKVGCTLDDIAANIEDFYNDFSEGGWKGWIELSKPKNHLYGAYLLALGEKSDAEAKAKEAAKSEAMASEGFMGRKCTEEDVSDGKCTTVGEIITPGSIISGMATNILNMPAELLTGITKDIIKNIPPEFQPYAEAILSAFFNQILKDSMQAILGHGSSASYSVETISYVYAGSNTPEAAAIDTATAVAGLNALGNVKTILDAIISFLVEINNKEIDILTFSVELFSERFILPLPSFISYSIISTETITTDPTYNIVITTIRLTASGVGSIIFERRVATERYVSGDEEPSVYVTTNIISIPPPEIVSDQGEYDSINSAWNTANIEYEQYLAALQAVEADPNNITLQATADAEGSDALIAVNNLLSFRGLSSFSVDQVSGRLHTLELIFADELGENAFDTSTLLEDCLEPFLSSYYFQYYYDFGSKELEIDEILNPPPPGNGNGI